MIHKIIYVSVKKLHGLKKNPRKIDAKGLEALKKSIKKNPKFFEARPCLVNNRTGKYVVYGGNQRLRAAKEIGIDKVPCIVENLTKDQEEERNLRDNILLGDWNRDILLDEFNVDKLEAYKHPDIRILKKAKPKDLINLGEGKGSTKKITVTQEEYLEIKSMTKALSKGLYGRETLKYFHYDTKRKTVVATDGHVFRMAYVNYSKWGKESFSFSLIHPLNKIRKLKEFDIEVAIHDIKFPDIAHILKNENKTTSIQFNPEFLLSFLSTLPRTDATDSFKFEITDSLKPLRVYQKNKLVGLIMPIRITK